MGYRLITSIDNPPLLESPQASQRTVNVVARSAIHYVLVAGEKMTEVPDERLKALRRLLFLAALMGLAYLCTRTLRFTKDFLNIAFVCSFFLIPFLAAREALRLGGWLKVVTTILLVPLLAVSMVSLLLTVSCDLPDAIGHVERSRELAYVQEGNYSVHLLWNETAGGALGPHGVLLEQRMPIEPGLYLVKPLDYFEGASHGSLSAEGGDIIRLSIPKSNDHEEVNKVYSLKRRVVYW
jgi:hypothetical protein